MTVSHVPFASLVPGEDAAAIRTAIERVIEVDEVATVMKGHYECVR